MTGGAPKGSWAQVWLSLPLPAAGLGGPCSHWVLPLPHAQNEEAEPRSSLQPGRLALPVFLPGALAGWGLCGGGE